MNYIHGESCEGQKTPLYRIWNNLKARCDNKDARGYDTHGGIGIDYYKEWSDFVAFRDWSLKNGYKDGLHISRNDREGGYYPGNVEFVTKEVAEGRANETRRVLTWEQVTEIRNSMIIPSVICKEYGVDATTIVRIRNFDTYKKEVE